MSTFLRASLLNQRLIPSVLSSRPKFYATDLKAVLADKIPKHAEMVKKFRKSHGNANMGSVILNQMYGGMRGIKSMVWEMSVLDPDNGIRFRGLSIPDCQKQLPRAKGSEQPLPEGIFWLLITGDVPTAEQANFVSQEWAKRSKIPDHTVKTLDILKNIHPMGQLAAAVISMTNDSKFRKAYDDRVNRTKYWEYVYEDIMDLLGKLIVVGALIYRNTYKGGAKDLKPDPTKDWGYNYGKMMGYDDKTFIELLRMYLTIHTDHEGGNVSAHTVHLVGSALSDPYLSYAAGMLGLAGPLHGLANQEVLVWVKTMLQKVGDKYTEQDLKDFIWATLKSGNVVPGYGHAVLRKTDPRYTCQLEFAQRYMPDDKLCKLVSDLYKVVPPILTELGKVANPWPNVDAHSGCLLFHFGMVEMNYYTVMFAISRAIGVLSQLVWSRGMSLPIERPKSFSTEHLMKELKA